MWGGCAGDCERSDLESMSRLADYLHVAREKKECRRLCGVFDYD